MSRSIEKEISIKRVYKFEDGWKPGVVSIFRITKDQIYVGWVTETNESRHLDPEVASAAREFLKSQV